MTIGAFHLTVIAMSSSSRAFDLWTIWLTANGAAGRSGCARSWAASASVISCSHSSSCEMGRALSAGKEPTIPALHWAITSAGCETMNNGAPTTGSLSLSFRTFGSAIEIPSAAACDPPLSFTDKPTPPTRASACRRAHFGSVSQAQRCCPTPPRPRVCASHGMSVRASSISVCGGLTTRSPARASGCWPCAPIGPIADVQFEPQDVWRAERGDRIEETGIGLGFADRAPGDVGSARPFAQSAFERPLDGARFVRRLERRVDQDDAPPLLRRHISVERDIAVRADDAEPPIAPKRGDQRLAFVRVRFAERDAILRAHEGLRDRWRTRIADRPALGVMRADGLQIGAQEFGDRRGRAAPSECARSPRAIPASASLPCSPDRSAPPRHGCR